jgi:hypothetical protein
MLLRTRYPYLEFAEDGWWVRIPTYPVPGSLWNRAVTPVAFQIPPSPAQEPYGFYVPKEFVLKSGGTVQRYSDGSTPFPGAWGKFSWNITWRPAEDLATGTTMLDFVASFAGRLLEGA